MKVCKNRFLGLHLKLDKIMLLKASVRSAGSEFQIVGAVWTWNMAIKMVSACHQEVSLPTKPKLSSAQYVLFHSFSRFCVFA